MQRVPVGSLPPKENGEAPRMESTGGRLPCQNEGYRAEKEGAEKALPELTEGQTLSVVAAIVKEGKSSPPLHFTDVIFCERKEWIGIEERSSA